MGADGRTMSAGPRGKYQPLGFKLAAIAAGTAANVTAKPPKAFTGRKIIIPDAVAVDFDINSLTVENQPQLASKDPVPAVVFGQTVRDNDLEMDRCGANGEINFNVTNTNAAARDFKAGIFGYFEKT